MKGEVSCAESQAARRRPDTPVVVTEVAAAAAALGGQTHTIPTWKQASASIISSAMNMLSTCCDDCKCCDYTALQHMTPHVVGLPGNQTASNAIRGNKAKQSKRAIYAHKQDGCTQSIASYMNTEHCGILWLEAASPGSMQLPPQCPDLPS